MKKCFILTILLLTGMIIAAQVPWNGSVADACDGGDSTADLVEALNAGAKSVCVGQEWEHSIEYSDNDTSCFNQYDAVELSNGNIAVGAALFFKSGAGDFYSAQPAVVMLSSNGEELARKDFFKPGFCTTSTTPFLFENQGALYALMTYNPDHDSTYFNHFMNNENPPTDAILGLYKLDDDLSIIESCEHTIPIDTFENRGDAAWDLWPNELSGNLFLFSAIIDEGNIVGAYFKTVSHDYFNPRGNDTLFLFRMNFDGEIIEQKGYDWGVSGANHQNNERRAHIVSTESGYIYYFGNLFGGTAHQGVAYYYDKNFNYLKKRFLKHPGEPNQNSFTNISVKRSCHNTTYLVASTEVKNSNTDRNIRLYELDDYQSASTMSLKPIPLDSYSKFITCHFEQGGFHIDSKAIQYIYEKFDGTTWYIQKICNELYAMAEPNKPCTIKEVDTAINQALDEKDDTYQDLLARLSARQKALLFALAHSGKNVQPTSGEFIKKYRLTSASAVQRSLTALQDKDIVTNSEGKYFIYDYFLYYWLNRK